MHPVIKALQQEMALKKTTLCIGLDPDPSQIPSFFGPGIRGIERFLIEIMGITAPHTVAYKPNVSFFEALGMPGLHLLERLAHLRPPGCVWVVDGKRGDIGNTAAAQARFVFDILGADATTVSPYMGEDSVAPFIGYQDRLVYLLALTSNQGADTLQTMRLETGEMVYEKVIRSAHEWGHSIGFVVGATSPHFKAAASLSEAPLLIPGIGYQGAQYGHVLSQLSTHPSPCLLSVSRAVLYGDTTAMHFGDDVLKRIHSLTQ